MLTINKQAISEATAEAVKALMDLWALTLRHYGPGPHPGTGTPQDVHGSGRLSRFAETMTSAKAEEFKGILYHGTLRKNLEDISMGGMVPSIGPTVEQAYGEYLSEEYNNPETGEPLIQELLYFTGPRTSEMQYTDETAMAKAFGYVKGSIAALKYGTTGHEDVTWDDVREYGLMITVGPDDMPSYGMYLVDAEQGGFYEVNWDWQTEEIGYSKEPSWIDEFGTGPEPGDYITTESISPTMVIYGDELVRLGKALESDNPEAVLAGQMEIPFKTFIRRHYGPGSHPGTGTPQDVHGRGGINPASIAMPKEGVLSGDEVEQAIKIAEEKFGLIPISEADFDVSHFRFKSFWIMPDGRITENMSTHADFLAAVEHRLRGNYPLFTEDVIPTGIIRANYYPPNPAKPKAMIVLVLDPDALNDETERTLSDLYWKAKTFRGQMLDDPDWIIDTFEGGELNRRTIRTDDYRLIDRELGVMVARHYGPGPHPGTGTPQEVHGGNRPRAAVSNLSRSRSTYEEIAEIRSALERGKTLGIEYLIGLEEQVEHLTMVAVEGQKDIQLPDEFTEEQKAAILALRDSPEIIEERWRTRLTELGGPDELWMIETMDRINDATEELGLPPVRILLRRQDVAYDGSETAGKYVPNEKDPDLARIEHYETRRRYNSYWPTVAPADVEKIISEGGRSPLQMASLLYPSEFYGAHVHEVGHHAERSPEFQVATERSYELIGSVEEAVRPENVSSERRQKIYENKIAINRLMSEYATERPTELIAEAYTMWKHPDYQALHTDTKRLIEYVLGKSNDNPLAD